MSTGVPCTCGKNKLSRKNWQVTKRNYRRSAFDGYREMSSDYSEVRCLACGGVWRTKAKYVKELKDVV